MQVVRPGLGEILPWMRGRVSRDEALRPIRRRALLVVALERRVVVLRIVAERRATLFELAAVAHQNIPIMVSDLVPEMAEQAAIGLGQFRAALLDLGAVGFRERDRHHAVVVPGHHFGAGRLGRIGQEFERQTVGGILGAGLERQLPAKQAVEQPVLGEFDVPPGGRDARAGRCPGSCRCAGRRRRDGRGLRRESASCRRRNPRWRRSGAERRRPPEASRTSPPAGSSAAMISSSGT